MPKTILLTGASKGLGLATLQILLSSSPSPRVISISRSLPQPLLALRDQYPDNLELVQGDVAERATSEEALERIEKRWPGKGLDGLLLNAGVLEPLGRIGEVDVEEWQKLFNINFFALVHTIQVALSKLRESKGTIVLVSSGAAEKGNAGWGAYASSKAAMNQLARTLGTEEPDVFTVAIRPGTVDTDMQSLIRSAGGPHMSAEDHAKFTKIHADKELLDPKDPGHVLAMLSLKGGDKAVLSGKFWSWNSPELESYARKTAI